MILDAEHEMIRDTMRAFAQERLAPFAARWDREHTFPREALRELGELGAMGVTVPVEWGGAGLGYVAHCVAMEDVSRGSASVGLS